VNVNFFAEILEKRCRNRAVPPGAAIIDSKARSLRQVGEDVATLPPHRKAATGAYRAGGSIVRSRG
jgi:hypothetical protein